MMSLSSMQSTAAAAIAANAYFTASPAVSCIVDDGLQDSTIENALRSMGCIVVIPPILRAARRDVGAGKILLEAEMVVRVLVNPQVNAATGGANRNIYQMVAAASQAIMAWVPGLGDRKFETAEEFFQLITSDSGLLSYDVYFTKLTTIN